MTRLTQGIPLPSDNISGNTEKIKAFYAGNLAHGWVLPKSLSSNGKRAATSSKVSEEIRRGYPRNRCPNAGFIPEERPARFGEYTNLRPETILGPTIMGGQSRTLIEWLWIILKDLRWFENRENMADIHAPGPLLFIKSDYP